MGTIKVRLFEVMFLSCKKQGLFTERVDFVLLLNFPYHNTLIGHIVSKVNNLASEEKRQCFTSRNKNAIKILDFA